VSQENHKRIPEDQDSERDIPQSCVKVHASYDHSSAYRRVVNLCKGDAKCIYCPGLYNNCNFFFPARHQRFLSVYHIFGDA